MSRGRGSSETKVYVGDLSPSTSKDEIESAFGYYGNLRNVWVARNPPGFAFIEFDDLRDAEDAVRNLDGKRIGGRRVRVEISTGKAPRSRGGSRSSSRRLKPFNPTDRCYRCGIRGHYAYDCEDSKRRSGSRSPLSRSRSRTPPPRKRRRSSPPPVPPRSRSRSRSVSSEDSRSPSRSPLPPPPSSSSRNKSGSRGGGGRRSRSRSRSSRSPPPKRRVGKSRSPPSGVSSPASRDSRSRSPPARKNGRSRSRSSSRSD